MESDDVLDGSMKEFLDRVGTYFQMNLTVDVVDLPLEDELGFDSLQLMEFVTLLGELYDIELTEEATLSLNTLREWHHFCSTGVMPVHGLHGQS